MLKALKRAVFLACGVLSVTLPSSVPAAPTLPEVVLEQGVKVALLPQSQIVTPGSEFVLSLEVTRAGSAFNGFDATIGYDPAALTLVQQTPLSLQEGAYFITGCGSRFHRFQPGADRDTISDVLMCAGASLTGPGQIYKLRFRASNTAQVTTVRFLPGLQFYNAGLFVNPDSSTDAAIGIGVGLDVAPSIPVAPRLRLLALPNPSHGPMNFRIESDRSGWQRLLITDLQGRIVRRLSDGTFPAGARSVGWDGRNDSGMVAPPGRYMASIRVPGRVLDTRFALVR